MSRNQAPKYRTLLPTAHRAGQSSPPTPSSISSLLPKRKSTRIACKECHEKKKKCDGQKPSCSACRRHRQPCRYRSATSTVSGESIRGELEDLRARYLVLESFVTELRTASHVGALNALRRLRSSPPGRPPDVEPPLRQSGLSSSVSTENGLNSPLSEPDPVHLVAFLAKSDLTQGPSSPRVETTPVILDRKAQAIFSGHARCDLDLGSASPLIPRLQPVNIASDPRLKGLDISFWTAVPVTDLFATNAISSYLRSDHHVWELFDANYFFSDLICQRSDFCSSFLVNCLLAFASQTYAADFPSAASKGIEFETAAGVLWREDTARLDSETALTGLILLYLCFTTRLESDSAEDCMRLASSMAARMKLFGVEERVSDLDMSQLMAGKRSSMAHAAWGAFNSMSMHRRCLLDDLTSLPPLISSPGMPRAMEVCDEEVSEEGDTADTTE